MNGAVGSRTLVLALLSLAYVVSYYDRALMNVVGETVKREFLLSDKQLSLLTGAAFVALYGIGSLGAGWLVDRHNRKRLMVWSICVFSAMTAACGLANGFMQLALARAAVGISEAAGAPIAMSMLSNLYPPRQRPMVAAIFYAGGMVGVLVAFVLGSQLAAAFGWRMAFLVAGPAGFVLALVIGVFAREPAREAAASAAHGAPAGALALIRGNRALLWLIASAAVGTFMSTGMMSWLPMFFARTHLLDTAQMGLLFGPALGAGTIVGLLCGGGIGNRLASRSIAAPVLFCAAVMAVVIPLYVALLLVRSLPVALALTLLATAGASLLGPCFVSTAQTLSDSRTRGTVHGVMNLTSSLGGGALLPFLTGALSDHWAPQYGDESLRNALIVANLFCLVGVALFARTAALIRRDERNAQRAA